MAKTKVSSPVRLLSGEGKKAEKKEEKSRNGRYATTHVDHHDDGSMTVKHMPRLAKEGEDAAHDVSYAVKDLDELHDGLEEHLGEPNDGEEE